RTPDAASRHVCAPLVAVASDRARSTVDGHVSAVAAGHRPHAERADTASAADDFELFVRICRRADFLWTGFRSVRPAADPVGGAGALCGCHHRLWGGAIDRRGGVA